MAASPMGNGIAMVCGNVTIKTQLQRCQYRDNGGTVADYWKMARSDHLHNNSR